VAAYTGSGFLLSAVGLRSFPQPVVTGLICSAAGWRALLMTLGAMLGYPTFWGQAGTLGIVWSAAAGLLAILVGRRPDSQDQPLLLPVVSAFLTVLAGLAFRLILKEPIFWLQLPVWGAVACCSGLLFTQAARCRDPVTDWLVWGVGVLALSRIRISLGYGTGALLAVAAPFPAAMLAGAALDLSGSAPAPMTAAFCLACFGRMLPLEKSWKKLLLPAAGYLAVTAIWGIWEPEPLPALIAGGALGFLLPAKPSLSSRRGNTGVAQVRLELGAQMLLSVRQSVLSLEPPPIDREALLEKARIQGCGSCPAREVCRDKNRLRLAHLLSPRDFSCRKPERIRTALEGGQTLLRTMKADRLRRQEYRFALI
jgi:hypothetical protein